MAIVFHLYCNLLSKMFCVVRDFDLLDVMNFSGFVFLELNVCCTVY